MSEYHSYSLHYATIIACLNHFVQMYNALHHMQVKSQITEFPCLFYHLFALAWHLLSPTKTLCRNTNPRTGMLPRPVKPILPLLIIFFFCCVSSFISCSWLLYGYVLCEARMAPNTQMRPLAIWLISRIADPSMHRFSQLTNTHRIYTVICCGGFWAPSIVRMQALHWLNSWGVACLWCSTPRKLPLLHSPQL